ncbi:cation:proton antiporter [Streptacidiphilus sp. N1-3]|uniref:Cation:proton antiporter n=1 Tax=Streptacidiphilus alkalitolerans TaxID=3342712 RepID=A0ABV6XB11_9ACTN
MPTSTLAAPVAAPVVALPAHGLLLLLLQAGLLLLVALVLGRLAARAHLPAVAGELCAGVLLGPTVLGHLSPALFDRLLPASATQFHLLDAVGQFGVILLVGVTGMEVDLALVRRRRGSTLSIATAGLLLPLLLGIGLGSVLPASLIPHSTSRPVFALFLGVALCVSAMPVIAKTLADMNLTHRNVGQLVLAAAMVDDVVGWLLLSVVSAIAVGTNRAGSILWSIGSTVIVVTVVRVLGGPLVRRVMARFERRGDDAGTISASVVIMLLGAAAAQALHLEAMFGAFLAGLLIGVCAPGVLARLAPLRQVVLAVLAPLFFATAGLRIDLTLLRSPVVLGTALLVLAAAVLGKLGGVYLGSRGGRLGPWETLAVGAGLNSRGVIQIVIATAGLSLGVLTTATFTIVILVAITTSVMAAPLLRVAMQHIEHTAEEELRLSERLLPEPTDSAAGRTATSTADHSADSTADRSVSRGA